MTLYLCVACGGTKTAAVIIGRGFGEPSNISHLTELSIATIKVAVEAALALQQAVPWSTISLPARPSINHSLRLGLVYPEQTLLL